MLQKFWGKISSLHFNSNKILLGSAKNCGAGVLELTKLHIYKFPYDLLKTIFESQLRYPDTDSLPLQNQEKRFILQNVEKKRDILNELDKSKYPKDEFPRDMRTEFISLKRKFYSIFLEVKTFLCLYFK